MSHKQLKYLISQQQKVQKEKTRAYEIIDQIQQQSIKECNGQMNNQNDDDNNNNMENQKIKSNNNSHNRLKLRKHNQSVEYTSNQNQQKYVMNQVYKNIQEVRMFLENDSFNQEIIKSFQIVVKYIENLELKIKQQQKEFKDQTSMNIFLQSSIQQKDLNYVELVKSNIDLKIKQQFSIYKTTSPSHNQSKFQQQAQPSIQNLQQPVGPPIDKICSPTFVQLPQLPKINLENLKNIKDSILLSQTKTNFQDLQQDQLVVKAEKESSNNRKSHLQHSVQKEQNQRISQLNITPEESSNTLHARKESSNHKKSDLQHSNQKENQNNFRVTVTPDETSRTANLPSEQFQVIQEDQPSQQQIQYQNHSSLSKQNNLNNSCNINSNNNSSNNNNKQAQQAPQPLVPGGGGQNLLMQSQSLNLQENSQQQFRINQKKKTYAVYIGNTLTQKNKSDNEENSNTNNTNQGIANYSFTKADFQQHGTDFQYFQHLLDLNDNDLDIKKALQKSDSISYFKNLLSEDIKLKYLFLNVTKESYFQFYEFLLSLFTKHEAVIQIVLKIKMIIKLIILMSGFTTLEETLITMINEICQILDCDRVSVWILDKRKQILWTKVAKGQDKPLQLKIGQGIVGYVAKSQQTINILDAHTDSRFDNNSDKESNYRTKTILCTPILGNQSAISKAQKEGSSSLVGVIQAINKNRGFFTKDDEGVIKLIAAIADPILMNSSGNEQKIILENKYRASILLIQKLNYCRNMQQFCSLAQREISKFFDVFNCRICFYENKLDQLFFYNGEELLYFHKDQGIIGEVFTSQQTVTTQSCYLDIKYNQKLDINTQMPVITCPIFNRQQEVIGVIQVEYSKGIENIIHENGKMLIPHEIKQILKLCTETLAQVYENIILQQNNKSSTELLLPSQSNLIV